MGLHYLKRLLFGAVHGRQGYRVSSTGHAIDGMLLGDEGGGRGGETMVDNETAEWYASPLTAEDVLAGGLLLLLALFFIPIYALVAVVMQRSDKEIVGFRFLFSAALADLLLLVNYALWPGVVILAKCELVPRAARPWMQMYLDWAWFSMCLHYSLIAWSRFAAIRWPNAFRTQTRRFSYAFCAACYLLALVQVLATHFQPWYVTFYYEPSAYGMLAEDFLKYMHDGQSLMFLVFHSLMIAIPIVFYTYAIVLLIKHRKRAKKRGGGEVNGQRQSATNVESRLILPCIINSAVFIVGQVLITVGTGEGRWATWTVMLVFSANSAVNPLLYICCSSIIRNRLLELLRLRRPRGASPATLRSNNNGSNYRAVPVVYGAPGKSTTTVLASSRCGTAETDTLLFANGATVAADEGLRSDNMRSSFHRNS